MAHFILEYSSNLSDEALALDNLFEALHRAAVDTGLFPLAGLRSRAHRCSRFCVADGTEHFAFVHLQVRIGAGRTEQEKELAARQFFEVLSRHLEPIKKSRGLAVSFELTELPEKFKYNDNNLRDYLAVPQEG